MVEPLTASDIQTLVRDVKDEQQFKERNTTLERRRQYVHQRSSVSVPGITEADGDGLKAQFRSPKFRDDAFGYQEKFLSVPYTIDVTAIDESATAQQNAQRMKDYALRRMSLWKRERVLHQALFDLASVGKGVIHGALNREILPIVPQPNEGESPSQYIERPDVQKVLGPFKSGKRSDLFVWESVKWETVYHTPDRSVRFLAAEVPLNPLAAIYAKPGAGGYAATPGAGKRIEVKDGQLQVTTLSGAQPTDTGRAWQIGAQHVTLYIVEDKDFCYHMLLSGKSGSDGRFEDALIGVYKNYFGTPAFFDFDARVSGDPREIDSVIPLIDGLYQTEPLVALFGTLVMDAGVRAVQARSNLNPAPGPEAAQERSDAGPNIIVRDIGGGYRLGPGGYIIAPSADQLPKDVIVAYQNAKADSLTYGMPPVIGQPQEVHASSGYDRSKAQDAVSSRMDTPLEHIGDGCAGMLGAEFHGIKELGIAITIRNPQNIEESSPVAQNVAKAITITPDMIEDVDLSVTFDSKTQYSRIAELEESMKLRTAGLMHKREILRDVRGIDDPARWEVEKLYSDADEFIESEALADVKALLIQIKGLVGEQAVNASGMAPFVAAAEANQQAVMQPPEPGLTPPPAAGETASIPSGPGSAMPIAGPPQNPGAELGMTAANASGI
jgi:hypothetical protein